MSPFAAAVGVFSGVAALVIAFIQYRKHQFALVNALVTTIKTLEKGRTPLVAVREDFPLHKELIDNLYPYFIFSRKFKIACREYVAFHEEVAEVSKNNPIVAFLDNSEATKEFLTHLNNLKNLL